MAVVSVIGVHSDDSLTEFAVAVGVRSVGLVPVQYWNDVGAELQRSGLSTVNVKTIIAFPDILSGKSKRIASSPNELL